MGHIHLGFFLQQRQRACEQIYMLTSTTTAEWNITHSESGGRMSLLKEGNSVILHFIQKPYAKMFNVGSKEDNF